MRRKFISAFSSENFFFFSRVARILAQNSQIFELGLLTGQDLKRVRGIYIRWGVATHRMNVDMAGGQVLKARFFFFLPSPNNTKPCF